MRRILMLAVAAACALAPLSAEAQEKSQAFVSPFFGVSAGGDAPQSAMTIGIAAGWLGAGRWGFEGDVADAPEFFEQDGFRTDRRMTTAMGSVIYKLRASSYTPYVVGGLGVMRPFLAEAGDLAVVKINKAAFNVGGGVMAGVRDRLGVRADVRYLRSFGEDDTANPFGIDFGKFGFWRVTGGVTIGF